MAEEDAPGFRDCGTAPFIYFDIIPTFGVLNGAVQIELASRVLTPRADGGVNLHLLSTGHIRCSPAAAISLRDGINKALEMLTQPQGEQTPAANKLN